ncbi:MAG: hypothetical protein ACK417_09990 [Bacteroidia bacterium]
MHHSQKIHTLIACIADLRQAVNEMSAEATVHHADKELLMYHARLLYEALMQLEAADAVAPAETSKTVAERISEEVTHTLEEAIEEVISSGVETELDMHISAEPEPAEATTIAEEATFEADAESLPPSAEETPAAFARPEPEQAHETEAPEPETKEDVAEAVVTSSAPTPATQAPKHQSLAFSLTGIIEKTGDSQLVMAHLKLKPIQDLKSGIGLNEKFLFIRELFNNDHMAYAEAIEKLNGAQDLATAEDFLGNVLLPKYQWDIETEASMNFLHLIFRRFAEKA